jgi:hypothetical protein
MSHRARNALVFLAACCISAGIVIALIAKALIHFLFA